MSRAEGVTFMTIRKIYARRSHCTDMFKGYNDQQRRIQCFAQLLRTVSTQCLIHKPPSPMKTTAMLTLCS